MCCNLFVLLPLCSSTFSRNVSGEGWNSTGEYARPSLCSSKLWAIRTRSRVYLFLSQIDRDTPILKSLRWWRFPLLSSLAALSLSLSLRFTPISPPLHGHQCRPASGRENPDIAAREDKNARNTLHLMLSRSVACSLDSKLTACSVSFCNVLLSHLSLITPLQPIARKLRSISR
jgi:hypothetical protein